MVHQRLDVLAKMQGDVVLAVSTLPSIEDFLASARLI